VIGSLVQVIDKFGRENNMQNGYGQGDVWSSKTATEVGGLAGTMLNAPQPKSPPMGVSLQQLGQNIERLQQAIQLLQAKLEPVLYSEPPSPAGAQGVETRGMRASSNLGSSINSYADQIEAITDRVNGMVRRCEL
jgi:glycogen synthase